MWHRHTPVSVSTLAAFLLPLPSFLFPLLSYGNNKHLAHSTACKCAHDTLATKAILFQTNRPFYDLMPPHNMMPQRTTYGRRYGKT